VTRLFDEILGDAFGLQLEKHVFNHTIRLVDARRVPRNWGSKRFRFLYLAKVRSLRYNLNKYEHLAHRMRTGQLGNRALVEMTPKDLRGESDDSQRDVVSHADIINTVPDGAFRCRRCKSWKTTYYEMQTRSADEPMTVFVTCLNCDNRWKG
jgi:DNA-directed RNA polymerase subunit M/transcription elongation factor TFIIS